MPAKPPTTTTRTIAYHSCSRQRSDLSIDDVPLAAPRADEILAELLADVEDVNIEQVRKAVFVFVEQVLVNLAAADDTAALHGQQFDEGIFAGSKQDRMALARDALGAGVDRHAANADDRIGGAGSTANEGSQSCQQFAERERLDEIIVRAGVEPANAVGDGVAR